jgi:hypothetical protein
VKNSSNKKEEIELPNESALRAGKLLTKGITRKYAAVFSGPQQCV